MFLYKICTRKVFFIFLEVILRKYGDPKIIVYQKKEERKKVLYRKKALTLSNYFDRGKLENYLEISITSP